MFSVLSHVSPVNFNISWIFTIVVIITISLGFSTQPHHFWGAKTAIPYVSQPLCLFPLGAPTESLYFQPIFLFNSSTPIETLYFSQLISLPFRGSNRNFTSLNSSLSSIQVLQIYVSQLISLLPSGVSTEIICLSTFLSPSSLQVTLIPRYLFWLRSTRGTCVADATFPTSV